jgi:cold shock CspA family protein
MIIGSITTLLSRERCGWILGEDGNEVYFDEKGLEGGEFSNLSVGKRVQFETDFAGERVHAVRIRVLGRNEEPKAVGGHDRTPPGHSQGTAR